MRASLRWLAGAGIFLLAAGASAQEGAEPTEFERSVLRQRAFFDYGGFEPSLRTVLPEGVHSRWQLLGRADGTYTDNDGLDAERREGFTSDGTLGVGWLRNTPRLQAVGDYRFTTALYESDDVRDREATIHRAAGKLTWQAAERLEISGGGHLAQSLERGFEAPRLGVRPTRGNRSDEYGANGSYRWAPARAFSSAGSYRYRYVTYPGAEAEGDDVRHHLAREDLAFGMGARDSLALRYGFARQETLSSGEVRDNHDGGASWSHLFDSFLSRSRSTLTLSYGVARVRYFDGDETVFRRIGSDDHWSHTAMAEVSFAQSPRTDLAVRGGYQWIAPDEGSTESSWNAGVDVEHRFSGRTVGLAGGGRRLVYLPEARGAEQVWSYYGEVQHRFTERTRGNARWDQGWDYRPATSRTDATVLTESRRATARLESQLTRLLRGSMGAHYLWGNPRESLASGTSEKYWDAGGRGELVADWGRPGFLGLDYLAARRETDGSADDYLLQRGSVFCRRPVFSWLVAGLRYSHERRAYRGSSGQEDYFENRLYASVTATI
ncbi:MAG: hypothetical protein ACNA8S_13545 [Deferrisomatales bacterium]